MRERGQRGRRPPHGRRGRRAARRPGRRVVDAAHADARPRRCRQRGRHPRRPLPAAHDDGEPRGQAVHERVGELLRRRRVVRRRDRRGAARLARVAALRLPGRGALRDPRVEDPAARVPARYVHEGSTIEELGEVDRGRPRHAARERRALQRVRPQPGSTRTSTAARTRGTAPGATPTTGPTRRSARSRRGRSTRCPCTRVRSRRAAGLRIDATGRVLSVLTGEPIPGLYASGNCSNGAAPGCYAGPGRDHRPGNDLRVPRRSSRSPTRCGPAAERRGGRVMVETVVIGAGVGHGGGGGPSPCGAGPVAGRRPQRRGRRSARPRARRRRRGAGVRRHPPRRPRARSCRASTAWDRS